MKKVEFILSTRNTGVLIEDRNLLYVPAKWTPSAKADILQLTPAAPDESGTMIYFDNPETGNLDRFWYKYIGNLDLLQAGESITRENIRTGSYDPGSGVGTSKTFWVDMHIDHKGDRVDDDAIERILRTLRRIGFIG